MSEDERDPDPGMKRIRSDLAGPYRPADSHDILQPIMPVSPVAPPVTPISDDDLRRHLQFALDHEGRLGGCDIAMSVREGIVTVTGQVGTEYQRSLVTATANTVEGVLNVSNMLRVR